MKKYILALVILLIIAIILSIDHPAEKYGVFPYSSEIIISNKTIKHHIPRGQSGYREESDVDIHGYNSEIPLWSSDLDDGFLSSREKMGAHCNRRPSMKN